MSLPKKKKTSSENNKTWFLQGVVRGIQKWTTVWSDGTGLINSNKDPNKTN